MLCLLGALHITSDPVWQIIDRPGSTAGPAGLIALLFPCNAWVFYALLVGLSEQILHRHPVKKKTILHTAKVGSWRCPPQGMPPDSQPLMKLM